MTALLGDPLRVVRAVITNQIARIAPRWYLRLTGETGRGSTQETPAEIADYFIQCFTDYFAILDVEPSRIGNYLAKRQVLEYGPGDVPAMALLMVAHGAKSVTCVDRFPILSLGPKNIAVLRSIMERLEGDALSRASSCFVRAGDPSSGYKAERIEYLVRLNGLSGLTSSIDLIVSRAVLEHTNDLYGTFADMRRALRPNGVAIHRVDLSSHGLHRDNPLDFLILSPLLWSWMYGRKGVPNRLRVDAYRKALADNGFSIKLIEPVKRASDADVKGVRPQLAAIFQNVSDEDLSWLDFWLVCEKTG